MECPNCNYKYEYNNSNSNSNEFGKFFVFPLKISREEYDKDERRIYGCPKCRIIFFSEY